MKNLMFTTKNADHSAAIQNRLFNLGFFWRGPNGQTIANVDAPRIYAHETGKMSFGTAAKPKDKEGFTSATLDDLFDIEKPTGVFVGAGIRAELKADYTADLFYGHEAIGTITEDEVDAIRTATAAFARLGVEATINDGTLVVSRIAGSACKTIDLSGLDWDDVV